MLIVALGTLLAWSASAADPAERVTLEFEGASLSAVVGTFAEKFGVEIVVTDQMDEVPVYAKLENATLYQALKQILQPRNYVIVKEVGERLVIYVVRDGGGEITERAERMGAVPLLNNPEGGWKRTDGPIVNDNSQFTAAEHELLTSELAPTRTQHPMNFLPPVTPGGWPVPYTPPTEPAEPINQPTHSDDMELPPLPPD